MKGFARTVKDAFPDQNKDFEFFKKHASELRANGITGNVIMHNPTTGSHMHYDLDNDNPCHYEPYIKTIFTRTTDID